MRIGGSIVVTMSPYVGSTLLACELASSLSCYHVRVVGRYGDSESPW